MLQRLLRGVVLHSVMARLFLLIYVSAARRARHGKLLNKKSPSGRMRTLGNYPAIGIAKEKKCEWED